MRYSASEKYEIIRTVERSSLPVKKTLQRLDIRRSTFDAWLNRFDEGGIDALEDCKPLPNSIWNKLAQSEQDAVVKLALEKPYLSPREIAVTHTDEQARYVSESTVYRLLKANDRITSLAFILMQASDRFQHQTKRVNEMWQTDFTYYKVIGWGWYYLSTVMDDFSRYMVSWTLCTMMSAQDVKDTLDDALSFTGLNTMKVSHKPAAVV